MRITKKLREEAADLCAIAASNDWNGVGGLSDMFPAGPEPDDSTAAGRLAWQANSESWRQLPAMCSEGTVAWAAAEALLRTGWTP